VVGNDSDLALRDQLSDLRGLLALTMLMTDRRDEDEIVFLATTAAPTLGRCRIAGVYIDGANRYTGSELPASVHKQLADLDEGGGALTLPDAEWAWAFPLRSFDGPIGQLLVAAQEEPPPSELLLLRTLAQQTGVALANARLHAGERTARAELESTVDTLARTVEALQRKTAIHDRFTRVAIGEDRQQGIATALHELTGLPAAVEDRHGNLLAWAGPEPVAPHTKGSPARREHILTRAARSGRPIRADGRLFTLARPRSDVLAVLLLVDPEEQAGEQDIVALEHGATVLALELARLRSVADTELRLGRDIVADLISGGAGEVAVARARALGYDLERPHRVVIVEQPDAPTKSDTLLTTVRQASTRIGPGLLYMPRAGTVVLLATDAPDEPRRWDRLRTGVLAELGGNGRCRIGIGGICRSPADFTRSHHEAELALRLQRTSGAPDRAVVYDDLGVFQLLAEIPDTDAVTQFVQRWLGSLLEYDARNNTSLVETLSCHFEAGGNYDAAAAALTIGRTTLRYRLQRVRKISGYDLTDADTRFNLHLATRAWRTQTGG